MAELTVRVFECAACGAPLDMAAASGGLCRCRYCAYTNILAKEDQTDEVLHHLYNGDSELTNSAFERAYTAYQKAAELDPEESKAFFGMALAANQIKYVKDVVNQRWQAICYNLGTKKFSEDKNYQKALSFATEEQAKEYEARAAEIDYIRTQFYNLAKEGVKYDTFICVKVSEEGGGYTQDSMLAMKLYDSISASGAKPFYSEKDIGDRVGEDYEALILYALCTAKSFLLVCSNEDYLRTPWVQNEYSRYFAMLNDKEKAKNSIMIAFDGNVVERIPGIPGKIQGVNMKSFDASQKINEFVKRFINPEEKKTAATVKYCVKCGAENLATAKFCSTCAGDKFAATAEELVKKVAENAPRAQRKRPEPNLDDFDIDQRGTIKEYRGEGGDVVIPDGAKSTSWAFKKSSAKKKIKSINFPDTLTTISTDEFAGCTELTEIYLPDSIEFLGQRAFAGCTNLSKVSVHDGVVDIHADAFLDTAYFNDRHNWRDGCLYIGNCLCRAGDKLGLSYIVPDGTTSICAEAFATYTDLRRISICEGVEFIGGYAFNGCAKLTSVELPESLKTIESSAFKGCSSLTEITIPSAVTKIGSNAFAGCTSLKRVTISNGFDINAIFGDEVSHIKFDYFDGAAALPPELEEGVTNPDDYQIVNGVLKGYTGKDECIVLPAGITRIGDNVFAENKTLKKVVVPDGVKRIGANAFGFCSELLELKLPDSINYIDEEAFLCCMKLKELNITDNVTYIGQGAFKTCRALCHLHIPAGLEEIPEGLFMYCNNLEEITIPETVTKIGSSAFSECKKVKEISIHAGITEIGSSAFLQCTSLQAIRVDPRNPNYAECDGVLFNKQMDSLIAYPAGKIDTGYAVPQGVVEIRGNAFSYAQNLVDVSLSSTVKKLCWGAFSSANAIEAFIVPINVTEIENYCFSGCNNLKKIIVPSSLRFDKSIFGSNPERVQVVRADVEGSGGAPAVARAAAPVSSSAPSYNRADFTIEGGILKRYRGKGGDVVIPEGVTEVDSYVFNGNTAVTSVVFPGTLKRIGNYAFDGCTSLKTVTFPEGITHIGDKSFYHCTSLQALPFPSTLVSIGTLCFAECTSLTTVRFPYGLAVIERHAFARCSNLREAYIPSSVRTIDEEVFDQCGKATVYCRAKKPFFGVPAGWHKHWAGTDRPKAKILYNASF
ncbi:MAG: hypothetical protein E7663_04285 [Ruminococcaceae bacterium]|nr:hypothetical protein [Oscillospiraceae bacterium]